ncbi:hypothetical protein A9814_06080, partial [Escherichia coli]
VPVCGQADGIQNGISKFGRVFRLHSGSISREFSGRVLRDFRKCFQGKNTKALHADFKAR